MHVQCINLAQLVSFLDYSRKDSRRTARIVSCSYPFFCSKKYSHCLRFLFVLAFLSESLRQQMTFLVFFCTTVVSCKILGRKNYLQIVTQLTAHVRGVIYLISLVSSQG